MKSFCTVVNPTLRGALTIIANPQLIEMYWRTVCDSTCCVRST